MEGISYIWLGKELGGFRSGGYVRYMNTEEYAKGIEKLKRIINSSKHHIAIMCSEKLWFKCHRRFISDTLVKQGYTVIHIIDFDKTYKHRARSYQST